MIPIRDDNPIHHVPAVTIGLIVINCIIFFFQATLSPQQFQAFVFKYGFVPAKLTQSPEEFKAGLLESEWVPVRNRFGQVTVVRQQLPVQSATSLPASLTIFSAMFLHGGWMHLIGNMIFLWIFGNNIEDRLGPLLYIVFYLCTGIMGNLAHTFFESGYVPLVGASGAISGLMGGYLILFPHSRILAIVPLGWYWFTVKLPAWMYLAFYVGIQNLFPAYFGQQGGVAHWAHIGGFAAGLGMIMMFPRRKHPVFAKPAYPARPVDDDDADFVL